MDEIIEKKMNKVVKKITKVMETAAANLTESPPMEISEVMELITASYAKKGFEINKRTELFFDFDDFVYSVIQ